MRSKFKDVSASLMYATHCLMVIHPCAKYGKPMSYQKKVMGWTRKHVKNPINLTLRSKFKVVSGSWMYATHRLMVIHPCAKYGKPVSNQIKVMGWTRICTVRQSDSCIPPWTLFTGGIIKIVKMVTSKLDKRESRLTWTSGAGSCWGCSMDTVSSASSARLMASSRSSLSCRTLPLHQDQKKNSKLLYF